MTLLDELAIVAAISRAASIFLSVINAGLLAIACPIKVREGYHLQITAARSALYKMGSCTNIIDDGPFKPRDHDVCPFWVDLYL
ncbi:hypothetical protein Hanom_Chr16g01459451 [Helianthus anomalus]